MAITRESEHLSLASLQSIHPDLTGHQHRLLALVNHQAAQNNIDLSRQSPNMLSLLMQKIKSSPPRQDSEEQALKLYALLREEMQKQTYLNQKMHREQGNYTNLPLHQRALKDEMQDHDIQRMMPESTAEIEVFAPVNRFDSSTEAVQEGIKSALAKQAITHLFIPVGPGHWRGLYVTKPCDNQDQFQLEIFDPYGPANATAITGFAKKLLENCGIDDNKLTITHKGPIHPQKDGYACGDFTCAYSHKKMKILGAKHYHNELISTLDTFGNSNHALRKVTRSLTSKLMGEEKQHLSEPHQPKSPEQCLKQEITRLKKSMDPVEKQVYESTIALPKKAAVSYRHEVASLIKCRDTIFDKANMAIQKERTQSLTDEELAAKLQAEELEKAGFRRQ